MEYEDFLKIYIGTQTFDYFGPIGESKFVMADFWIKREYGLQEI